MSKYTTEVRFLCETYAGLNESAEYPSIQEILDRSRDKIFDFDFPIFDENYRTILEDKILKHYYTREIGAEAVGLWKLWLDTRLNEIMPYYNQLYASELIKFNPMYDVDLTTTHQKTDDRKDNVTESELKTGNRDTNIASHDEGATHSESNTDTNTDDKTKNDHWEMFSDTPSGGLEGVRDEKYLTTALHTTDDKNGSNVHSLSETSNDGTSSTDSTMQSDTDYSEDINRNKQVGIKNIQDYAQHVVGKTTGASYSKMLNEFRTTFLNIDVQIIEELSDLFMTLW
jgi:hypothetical protein